MSPPGSSVHGIFQARILDAVSFSRGSSWPRNQTRVSGIGRRILYSEPLGKPENRILTQSVQFRSVAQSCLTLCDPMNHSTPGLPVLHQLLEFTQTHVHRVGDAIQPSHPLSSPSPPAPNPSQHQGLFQWVNSFFFSVKELCLIYVNTSLTGDWQTKLCPIEQFE